MRRHVLLADLGIALIIALGVFVVAYVVTSA